MANGIFNGNVTGMTILTATVNLGSVAANTTATASSITLSGVEVGDYVMVVKPTLDAGLFVSGATVTATNTISMTVGNCTGSPIDPASQTFRFLVVRPENPNNIPTTVIK